MRVFDELVCGSHQGKARLAAILGRDVEYAYRSDELLIVHVNGLVRFTIRITASWNKRGFNIKLDNARGIDVKKITAILEIQV